MDKRLINIHLKYSLDDSDSERRKAADMLINGIDIGAFAPGLGRVRITGRKIVELALERLARDIEAAEKRRDEALNRDEEDESSAPKPAKRKSSLERLSEGMGS
jgi:hypothetical protein